MAAVYLYHIVRNHPFVDGNKRTGAVAAYSFLAHNGYELDVPEEEFEEIVLGVAKGEVEQSEVKGAALLLPLRRQHRKKLSFTP